MEKKIIGGQEYEVYTMTDWARDRTLSVKVGQVIEPDVYYQLLNSVPPMCYRGGYFQPGEPYDHDWNTGKALYQTFKSVGDNYYLFEGLMPAKSDKK